MADLSKSALNIEDLRRMAKRRLTKGLFEFVDRGSEDDVALRHNRDALERIKLRSRVLNNTSERHTKSTIFGEPVDMPLVIGPTGPAGLSRRDRTGEGRRQGKHSLYAGQHIEHADGGDPRKWRRATVVSPLCLA